MQLRVKFAKLRPVRYISHLELMKTLRRAFRRAKIPVAYSKGYNPHQLLSMGPPLSVGMTGKGEYFDLELKENLDTEEFKERVNSKLPGGIKIIEVRPINKKVKSLMAVINRAKYDFKFKFTEPVNEELICNKFLEQKEIKLIRKRRRKKDKEIDIRPMIHEVRILEPGCWRFTISTGSQGNLRPGEVIRAIANFESSAELIPLIRVEREGLYVDKGGELLSPYDQQIIGS